jgi:glycerate kinase
MVARHAAAVRVVIAPDSFKGSLAADRAADALATGVARALPAAALVLRPVADGGEGTVAAALRAGWTARTARVALGRDRLSAAGFTAAHALTEIEPDPARCRAEPERLLADLAARVVPSLLLGG